MNPILATGLFTFGTFGFFLIGNVQRKRITLAIAACTLTIMSVGLTSCGGSRTALINATKSVPSTYAITVDGTANGIQLSTSIRVTLQ